MKSQKDLILNHLKKIGGITPLDALRKYGCFRLGSRICELRQEGNHIDTIMVEQHGKRFAKYILK